VKGTTPMAYRRCSVVEPSGWVMTMYPSGIMRMPEVRSISPNARYITRRAPHRSASQPPSGRSSEAGKMKTAVRKPAVASETSKLVT